MKIGIIADPHYSSAEVTCGIRRNSLSLGKVKWALDYFAAQGCGRVILLGDITDTEPEHDIEAGNLRSMAALFDDYPGDITCLMGNHDAFAFEADEFYGIIGEARRPRLIRMDGAALVFIDACYFSDGRRYAPGDSNWQDTYYPHTEAMTKELAGIDCPVYVFMHQNIDPSIPDDHRLSNDADIRGILEAAGNVKHVYQGHYHPGNASVHNGICYTALPAMCQNEPDKCIMIAEV